jgi:CRP/FNR family transcriptional regulator, dissimilatory nitrate respiration regulator
MSFLESAVRDPLPRAVRDLARRVEYPKSAAVFHQGDSVRAVFQVLGGEVRLARFGRDGAELVLQRARPGEFFAEASLDSGRYHCNAIASEEASLLEFPAQALRELLDKDTKFARQWAALLARELRNARARLERQSLGGAAERVRHYLITEGRGPACKVELAGSLKDLARELGLAHETLYRTLARMADSGELEREGATLRLKARGQRI